MASSRKILAALGTLVTTCVLGQGNLDLHTSQVGNVGNNPPPGGNTPTPFTTRVTPVCVTLTVDSIPQPSQFYPDDGQGPIDVNNLLFRLRETLCRNTCGPVAGVPADDMNFVPSADGKGCLIAVAIPGLKQAYMYRSVATVGDPWDQQCWQSIEDIISTCVQNGPNKGSVSGPNNGQYYEGGISWLNSEHPGGLTTTLAGQHVLPTQPNQPEPSTPPAFQPSQPEPSTSPTFRPSPSCLPFAVENVPPQLVLSDSSLTDPNNLLFRIRQTLCTNPCGSVEGVPAEVMTSVPTYDGKGCFIAIALPNLKQAYMYRSVATNTDSLDSACWASFEDIISTCVQNGPNFGTINGPKEGQYYEGGYGPINGAHPGGITYNLDEHKYLPTPSPAASTGTPAVPTPTPLCQQYRCEHDCCQYIPSSDFCIQCCGGANAYCTPGQKSKRVFVA